MTPRSTWQALVRRRGRPTRRSRGGIALLVVVTTLMVLTVLVSELAYGSTVRLTVSSHHRDRTQAYWLARTGVSMYQLILTANKQLASNAMFQTYADSFGINLGDALWQMVPMINTGLMRMLLASDGDIEDEDLDHMKATGTVSDEIREASVEASHFSGKSFLDFDGDFAAQISDEESRININSFSTLGADSSIQTSATGLQLYGLMSGEEHDQWFNERNLDRWELIANVADWVDSDNSRRMGFGGYEDNLYNNLDSPYLAKNAPFDSHAEVRLVDGWASEVYDRYKDNLTVWGSGKININTASEELISGLLKAYVSPTPSDALCEQILQLVQEYLMLTTFQNGKDFVDYLKNQGLEVDSTLANQITTSSTNFTIQSTGLVGTSAVTITAVMSYADSTEGKVLYWRVD